MTPLPSSLIDTDLGRWYAFSYYTVGSQPHIRLHVYLENTDRFVKWARTTRSGLFYDLKRAGALYAVSYGDRYMHVDFPLAKSYAITEIQNDIATLLDFLRSSRELEHERFAHDPDRPQLMQIALGRSPKPSIGGILSRRMVAWLRSKKTWWQVEAVSKAMFEARNIYAEIPTVYKEDSPHPYNPIDVWIKKDGWLSLDCGGASCLVEEGFVAGNGYVLTCHNVDQSFQQICILAGLAVLHELAAKDLDRGPPDD